MRDNYSIELPNNKFKIVGYITRLLLFIHFLLFGLLFFKSRGIVSAVYLCGSIVIAIGLIFLFFRPRNKSSLVSFITFTATSLTWFVTGNILFGFIVLAIALFGIFATQKPIVYFNSREIIYPSFPPKHLPWAAISNVLLKDGVLTIDLENNKLMQVVLTPESASSVNERKFNAFCREQISATV